MTIAPLTFHKTAVGYSSWHRRWIKGQLEGTARYRAAIARCAAGRSLEILLTEGFDDFTAYRTRPSERHDAPVLEKNEAGSGVYLVDGGCSVYARRPLTCRTFDCRIYHFIPATDVAALPKNHGVRALVETTQQKFDFAIKEPDDMMFIGRLRAHIRSVQREQPDASVPEVLITALAMLAPKAFAILKW